MAGPKKPSPDVTRRDYARDVGTAALERQQAEAELRFDCCGELKTGGHHPMCRQYEPDQPVEVHPDQETLL